MSQLYVEQALDVVVFDWSAVPTFHASAKPVWVYGVEVLAAVDVSIDVYETVWYGFQWLVREHELAIHEEWMLDDLGESKSLPIVVLLPVVVAQQEVDSTI